MTVEGLGAVGELCCFFFCDQECLPDTLKKNPFSVFVFVLFEKEIKIPLITDSNAQKDPFVAILNLLFF